MSDLVSGGMAADSGLVQIGDMILKVNESNLDEISYEESVKLLKSLPINSMVVLILKGPEGYTSHLETRFSNEGIPRTIRITKPIISQDSFMERIKKTFISSTSPKPCQSKQTQANCDCVVSHANGYHSRVNETLVNGDIKTQLLENGNHVYEPKIKDKKVKNHKRSTKDCMTEDFNQNDTSSNVKAANGLEDHNVPVSFSAGNKTNERSYTKAKDDEIGIKINNVHSGQNCNINQYNKSNILHEGQKALVNSNEIAPRASDSKSNIVNTNQPVSVICNNDDSKSPDPSKSPLNITVQSENNCDTNIPRYDSGVKFSDTDGKVENVNGSVNTALDVNRQFIRPPSTPTFRKGSLKKFVKLRNVGDERPVCSDTLHQKASEVITRK